MSKEETVYVQNQLADTIDVTVERGEDGDIEVYINYPAARGEIVEGGAKRFTVPAGDD